MSTLVPLTVAIPLVAGAGIVAFGHFSPPRVDNLIALAASVTVCVFGVILLLDSRSQDVVHWFGGWQPRHGVALGISFTVDPFGAGLAALAGALMTAAIAFSWGYFEEVAHLYYTLMLVFLGAMAGFALTGDLFNLFVFFELMSVSAYALVAYRITQPSVLQGALNFAITNSIGAFMVLFGIGLLYGRTGALNFTQLGGALAGRSADGLVIASLVLITVGFLIKAGAVPFHFWLSDAYAVVPTPVGVILTGIMSDLGYYAIARVYWTVFSGPTAAHAGAVRGVLVGVGVLTALLGGLMCLLQADLKRLLAFLTVSHGGIFLAGIGLLRSGGLAGASLYVVADGALKAALFLAIGIVVIRLGSCDELRLHGRGRDLRHLPLALVFGACALALAAPPPFGPFLSKSLIEESATTLGWRWLPPLLTVATILTAGAVLRAAGRIFLGLGPKRDPLLSEEPDQPEAGEPEEEQRERSPLLMLLLPVALVVVACGLAFVPSIAARAEQQAVRFQDRAAYAGEVLRGGRPPAPMLRPHHFSAEDWGYGAGSAVGAVAVGLFALYRRRLPEQLRAIGARVAGPPIGALRSAHSGAIGDYAVWICVGAAAFGVVWTATLR